MQISKTDYMMYLRHPAWLWIKKHAKKLIPPVDDVLQARFDEGHAFEPFAESLFPSLMRLGFKDYSEYLEMPAKTFEAWENGAEIIAQGRYEFGSITCIADILRKDGDAYVLTEIKGSTSAKKEHSLDLAFQKIVIEGAGYPVRRCEVAHVNNKYIRKGDINPSELVAFTDITEEVEGLVEGTKARIEQAIRIANAREMPDPGPEQARLNSYKEWLEIRQKITPPLPDNSIHYLPSMTAEQSTKLAKKGITTLDDIDDLTVLRKSTQKYLELKATGERVVEKDELGKFLSEISFPVYYLDYEASMSLLPPWDGIRPYQQVPFQYSLHIQRKPHGEVEHHEFLHKDRSNPLSNLIESLKKHFDEKGSILVWNETFEKKCHEDMAALYPEDSKFLYNLNDRVIDLMRPFSRGIIRDEAFKSSASIKNVLPVLVPHLAYDGLGIQAGGLAALRWKEVTLGDAPENERKQVYSDLIEYCRLDTLAMVEIHKKLAEFCS